MMKNFKDIMKQAQQMQAKMQEVQESLADITAEGSAGGGMVKVTLTGDNRMKGVTIDPSLLNADEKDMLEDLIIAATNDAGAKLEEKKQEEMQKATADFALPPGMKLPF